MTDITELSPMQQLDERGFAVVEGVLEPERDLRPVLDEYEDVLDRAARDLLSQGLVTSAHADLPFARRLILLTRESGSSLGRYFDVSLPQNGIRSDTPIHTGPACFRLLTNERLLDLAQQFTGPEISVSPVGHVRIKLPEHTLEAGADGLMSKIPWHQDNGVILPEADQSRILTVWIPINEATLENGCLQVLPTPRTQELIEHCPTGPGGPHIPDSYLERRQPVPLPMRPGSVLLLHSRTVHSSLENQTADQVRISMDLRYQSPDQPSGRPMFPSFVARSRSHPERELRDAAAWSRMWLEARARLAEDSPKVFNRWDPNSPACA
jgi:hypothetical protein